MIEKGNIASGTNNPSSSPTSITSQTQEPVIPVIAPTHENSTSTQVRTYST
jgi:hypothetical protein